jgi:hypothetical protein
MDELTTAPGVTPSRPHPVPCPPWCTDCCNDDLDPPGTALHRSPPSTVPVYDQECDLVTAHVRAAFWDKAPAWIGTDPADLERPHVEITVANGTGVQLYLTPGQARSFAVGLVRAADAAETEASYRTPVSPGRSSRAAPAIAPPLWA